MECQIRCQIRCGYRCQINCQTMYTSEHQKNYIDSAWCGSLSTSNLLGFQTFPCIETGWCPWEASPGPEAWEMGFRMCRRLSGAMSEKIPVITSMVNTWIFQADLSGAMTCCSARVTSRHLSYGNQAQPGDLSVKSMSQAQERHRMTTEGAGVKASEAQHRRSHVSSNMTLRLKMALLHDVFGARWPGAMHTICRMADMYGNGIQPGEAE